MKQYRQIDKDNCTADWLKYEQGKTYNRKLKPSYYDNISINWDFYNGNQYPGLEDVDLPKPVFNIINRLVSYFVSALTSTKVATSIEPLAYNDDDASFENETNAANIANAEIGNLFDKFRMQQKVRDALIDGSVGGDYCAHIMFDPNAEAYGGAFENVQGEIQMELVDGSNVYMGNANNPRVDIQPYIIIAGRASVEDLKKEAEQYKNKDISISDDKDYEEQVGQGGQIEVEAEEGTNKATYIIIYRKGDNGRILVSKSVQSAYIYKDIDTGLKKYPIAWGNWEKQKNQYHGKALVTGLIPNQIYINKMFAMLMYFLMNNAFPKPVYDADKIAAWTTDLGVALPVRNLQPGESVRNAASYLDFGQSSMQVTQTIDLAMQYTKEMTGATDAALGETRPDNAAAVIAVQRQSSIPLENPKSNMYEWVYDICMILLDMMGAKYGVRPIVMEVEGQKQYVPFDFTGFSKLNLNVSVDIGSGSYWSEIANLQTLDNLLSQEKITFIQYLERIPENYIPKRDELINEIKEQEEQAQMMAPEMAPPMEEEAPQMDFEQMAQFVESLPEDVQQQIMSLPEGEQEQAIMGLMQQSAQ